MTNFASRWSNVEIGDQAQPVRFASCFLLVVEALARSKDSLLPTVVNWDVLETCPSSVMLVFAILRHKSE